MQAPRFVNGGEMIESQLRQSQVLRRAVVQFGADAAQEAFVERGGACGGEREFQVEVENVRLPAGTKLNVFIGTKKVGSMTLNALRAGRLNLNTTRGQTVPVIHSGSQVRVKTTGGTLVVSGIFP